MAQSDEEAERWWLKAGMGRSVEGEEGEKGEGEEGGEWESVVRAQNTLGMFYSRRETQDLGKVSSSCNGQEVATHHTVVQQLSVPFFSTDFQCWKRLITDIYLLQSLHWHSCAAENGHLESMGKSTVILVGYQPLFPPIAAAGLMRLNGRGCPRDVSAGLQLLKNAAAGGSLYASGLLALHYFTSKLFSKSTETALRYIY